MPSMVAELAKDPPGYSVVFNDMHVPVSVTFGGVKYEVGALGRRVVPRPVGLKFEKEWFAPLTRPDGTSYQPKIRVIDMDDPDAAEAVASPPEPAITSPAFPNRVFASAQELISALTALVEIGE